MTALDARPDVVAVETTHADEWEPAHLVCHCTDNEVAACGLNMAGQPWAEEDDDVCALCLLVWPDGSPCRWGCDCEECCC